MIPFRQIRASFDEDSLTVYQAYRGAIADAALAAGRFVEPFSRTRMTWIKPSFLWMMYRCGWATKPGQERVLAIRISRSGFEEALASSCLSHFDPTVYKDHQAWEKAKSASPVRIQWDPERDTHLQPLSHRSVQIGIGPQMVGRYVDEWIVDIADITTTVAGLRAQAEVDVEALPCERPYPLPSELARRIGATPAEV